MRVIVGALVAAVAVWLWLSAAPNDAPTVSGIAPPTNQAPVEALPAEPTATPVPLATALPPGQYDLCGHGRFEPTKLPTELPPDVDAGSRRALHALADRLQQGDTREQATGLALRSALAVTQALAEVSSSLPSDEVAASRRMLAAIETGEAVGASHRGALIRLAQASRDAEVYKLAYLTCQALTRAKDQQCTQLSALEWAQRDPADGLAWLYAVGEAHAAKDAAAREAAVYRVAQAQRFSPSWQSMSALAAQPLLNDLPISTQIGATLQLMLLQTGQALPTYAALFDHCSAAAIAADPFRRQRCSEAARVLVDKESTLLGMVVGLGLGERVGWAAEEVSAIREKLDAMRWVHFDAARSLPLALTCDGFASWRSNVLRHGAVGERGVIEERLAASGQSTAELARQYREAFRPPPTATDRAQRAAESSRRDSASDTR